MSATSRAGRSRGVTSSSCAAARAEALAEVARHNDQDVRSLGWLLAHIERRLGDPAARAVAPPGDLAGLARAFTRERRLPEALDCLDAAADRPDEVRAPDRPAAPPAPLVTSRVAARETLEDAPWWSPRRPADFGGPPRRVPPSPFGSGSAPVGVAWTMERIAVDRAHLLRRLGRYEDAVGAWSALAAGPGRTAVVAAIELAKIHEHRRHDPAAALAAADRGLGAIERRRRLGRPEPALEADLLRRVVRLRSRSLSAPRPGAGPLALFDRLDLRVLARADRQADSFPGTADQHGSPIRDPGQADVLDRERAGGGREAQIRGPSGARPPDDRRSQHGGHQGRQERVAGARSGRSPGPWRSAGSGPCPRAPSVPTRSSVPALGAFRDEQVGSRVEERGQVGQAGARGNIVVAHADQVGPAEQRGRRRGAAGDLPARNEVAEHPLPAER